MKVSRRTWLAAAASTLMMPAALRAKSSRSMRVLILGGTNYVGPHLVHGCQLAGHEVTLFNRGITNPSLFPDIEKLRGDRTREDGLAALVGSREWDIVIDTWDEHPRAIRNTARMLAERTASYVYISSIAVYGRFKKVGLTENDPTLPIDRAPSLEEGDISYPWAKRMGEHFIQEAFGDRATIVRGSSIFGYDYSTDPGNQNSYWLLRVRAGGDVAAPEDGLALVQWSDAAALADLAVDLGARRQGGSFNAINAPISFRHFLTEIQRLANPAARIHWIPQKVMIANGGLPFETVPLWIPHDDPEPGFYQFDPTKAYAAGMRPETIGYAIVHQLKSYAKTPLTYQPDWSSAQGLPSDVEKRILGAHFGVT